MSLLLVEQSGRRHPIELNGKLLIGRGSASKLRIDHPLVSRDHAIIEKTDAGYTLRDCGSRNGTTLNDAAVHAPVTLQDGDRISVGPTIIWFRADGTEPHVEPLPAHNADEGVVFECECTARLWAPMTLAGAQVRCRRCGRDAACPTIFASESRSNLEDRLGVLPPPAPPTDAEIAAAPTCSICLSKVVPSEEKHVCEDCGTVYHDECWIENCGCASYGCKKVNALSEDGEANPSVANPAADDDLAAFDEEAEMAAKAAMPWDAALIGVSVVAALLGVLAFGVLSLIVAIISAAYLLRRRTAWVVSALLLSLAGFVGGVVVSGLWWLQISPLDWLKK